MGVGADAARQFLTEHQKGRLEAKSMDADAKTTADLTRKLGEFKDQDVRAEFIKTLQKEGGQIDISGVKSDRFTAMTDREGFKEVYTGVIFNGREIKPQLESRKSTAPDRPGTGIGDLTPEEINRQYGRGTGMGGDGNR
jgi:hypothetical protein